MKINDTKPQGIPLAQTRAAKDAERFLSDKVSLDSAATHLTQTSGASSPKASSTTFDSKRVEEIKAAIANGTFKVDAGKIADGLISSVKDILGKK